MGPSQSTFETDPAVAKQAAQAKADAQNQQDLVLYQQAMVEHTMLLQDNPGRQGTILTGQPMTPTPGFRPTSIL